MARPRRTDQAPIKRRSISFDGELFAEIEEFGRATERGIDESVRWLIRMAIAKLKSSGEWRTSPGYRPDAVPPPAQTDQPQ